MLVEKRKNLGTRTTLGPAQSPAKNLKLEQRRFTFVRDGKAPKSKCLTADIQSAVNRARYQEKIPHFVRIQDVRRNDRETITGVTTSTASAKMLMNYRDTVICATRTVDAGIVSVEVNEIWKRLKIHGIPLARYVGKGTHGTEKLREEIEAENEGVTIPIVVRWLGRLEEIKERAMKGECHGPGCHTPSLSRAPGALGLCGVPQDC